MAVLTTQDHYQKLATSLAALTKTDILVGIPDTNAQRKVDIAPRAAGAPPAPFSNAAIAYIAENGSPINNVPARPFMRAGIDLVRGVVAKLFAKAGEAAMRGDADEMEKTFNAIGLKAADGMKKAIQDGGFTPLSARTLAARRARGRTGIKPLLDTGQLRNAITYILRRPAK